MTTPPIGYANAYICYDCALLNGCEAPDCDVTMHVGSCYWCKRQATLAHADDWDWPQGSGQTAWSIAQNRD